MYIAQGWPFMWAIITVVLRPWDDLDTLNPTYNHFLFTPPTEQL